MAQRKAPNSHSSFPRSKRSTSSLPVFLLNIQFCALSVFCLQVVPRNVLEQMPLSQKLFHFIQFICSEQPRINDIQTIENAITGCHLNLKTQYETEDVGTYQGRRVFSGKLSISSVFLARAVGHTKKELKHECYKLALQVLASTLLYSCSFIHFVSLGLFITFFYTCYSEIFSHQIFIHLHII